MNNGHTVSKKKNFKNNGHTVAKKYFTASFKSKKEEVFE
jgi:hypothetical protein